MSLFKSGFAVLAAFCLCLAVKAQDTSVTRLASNNIASNGKVVLKKSNVIYPAIFTGHEEESREYVEKFCNSRRAYVIRTYARSKKYFPKATGILKKYAVPAEFAVLMALESGFNAEAVSGAGAVGYWQFMDEVAVEYGLTIPEKADAKKPLVIAKPVTAAVAAKPVVVRDDRKNFIKSTTAAARYLRDRYKNLNGDWLLIAASYNCGVGTVWNAIKKTGKPNAGFWDIKSLLPAETRAYVMNFIALNVAFKNYSKFAANDLCFTDIYGAPLPPGL